MGAPRDMEGSQLRWEIHASIYESLTRHALSLLEEYGPDVIELGTSASLARESEYDELRLLEGSKRCEEAYNEIKKKCCERHFEWLFKIEMKIEREGTTKREICVKGRGNGDELEGLPDSSKVIALCLRGMLEFNVLKIALFRRWRVDYGNHPTRKGF